MSSTKHHLIPLITYGYILLLFIGCSYPFLDWQWPDSENWLASFESATRYVPRNDLIINFLIYVPLGVLISILLQRKVQPRLLLICATIVAAGISFSLEMLQLFIPSRAHSFIDLMMNISGAFAGALTHNFTKKNSSLGKRLRTLRYEYFESGRYAELGLIIIALWSLSELSPLAPALDISHIASDYQEFMHHLLNISGLNYFNIIAFAFDVFALFLLTERILIQKTTNLFIFSTFAGVIIYFKLPVADISLQPEHIWGLITGLYFFFITQKQHTVTRTYMALYALFFAYLINQLNHPVLPEQDFNSFNWLPFDSDAERINRVSEILNITWIFLALSFFTLSLKQGAAKTTGLIGLIAVTIITLSIEWQQRTLQNSSADITDVIIAALAWALPYFHPNIRKTKHKQN